MLEIYLFLTVNNLKTYSGDHIDNKNFFNDKLKILVFRFLLFLLFSNNINISQLKFNFIFKNCRN